jgi:putative Ca2+/H+ antiporter (TMEM165/GDT1 family)
MHRVNPGTIATVFVLIFVAELPDKTMIATLIMGSRYRPVLVWVGATSAFALHAALAVAAGQLIRLLPHRWVEGVTGVLFAAGAAYLLLVPERRAGAEGAAEVDAAGVRLKAAGTAFTVIFVGEFGDLTQILTANLAAKYHDPASVFVGALAALASVAALGAFAGRALLRFVPLAVIRRGGGVLLAGLSIYSFVQLARG